MKALQVILLVVGVVILVVVIGGAVALDKVTRGPLPQHSGEVMVNASTVTLGAQSVDIAGLQGSVEIIRDNWGVPHIYASSIHDLFFAQGYAQAQDRWWQMEFARHIGSGRIGELTGKNNSVLRNDVFIRKFGWRRVAEQETQTYDTESMALLQAFADGVNAYISSRAPGDLALEYTLLGLTGVNIEIEPWTPADSLVWAKVMADNLSGNWAGEVERSELIAMLGEDRVDEYAPEWPFDQIAPIDRNILRMAFWEFAVQRETPVKVAINEAVELAKQFGSDSAPRFVNGVLGSLAEHKDEILQRLGSLEKK